MNFREFIAKTITKQRGYCYHTYETVYNSETFFLYHYGTLICTFSLTKPLKNGEYIELNGGWSLSDRTAIDVCISHINDHLGTDYELASQHWYGDSKNAQKNFHERYHIVSQDNSYYVLKPKSEKQKTMYAYEPYGTIRADLNAELQVATSQIQSYVTTQIEYLKTFENTNLKITEQGIQVNIDGSQLLITYDGDVMDSTGVICVQIPHSHGLTTIDKCITKALGLIKNPDALKEGIHYHYRKSTPALAEVLMENREDLENTKRKIERIAITEVHEDYVKHPHNTLKNTDRRRMIGILEEKNTYQLVFKIENGTLTYRLRLGEVPDT